jgi:hypothetical protein
MGLGGKTIDEYGSINIYCMSKCPAMACVPGCLCCNIPMDLTFMRPEEAPIVAGVANPASS